MAWLLGISAGLGITLQVGMNAHLRKVLDSAHLAALISFLVGTLCLVLLILVTRTPLPDREALGGIPAWAWFGGVVGAFYVASATVVATELGATTLLALALLGQLAGALVVDHYGWMGLPVNPLTGTRIAGVALLGIGVWLVSR